MPVLPAIHGIIDRRMLVNYRADPEVVARLLPEPFRPKLAHGRAIVGICLIRLREIRPGCVPRVFGVSSENAAHRFAVEWDDHGARREGVFIPRRDTSSRLNEFLGGRAFPGVHHHARFDVNEKEELLQIAYRADDDSASVRVVAAPAKQLPATSVFGSIAEASAFFEGGSIGYSARPASRQLDGLELCCRTWQVQPLDVREARSSFFDDRSRFPAGSIELDCALLMRNIEHEWKARDPLYCGDARESDAA
jgi:hypothetical protein